ncbi:MAG: iron permease, partial [Oxalobacteraceae bacterium]
MRGLKKLIALGFTCALLFGLSTGAHAAEADVRRVWQMLDYLAVDYGGAVKDGAVASASEYEEMREFSKSSRARLADLAPHAERAVLMSEADRLVAAVDAKEDPTQVA